MFSQNGNFLYSLRTYFINLFFSQGRNSSALYRIFFFLYSSKQKFLKELLIFVLKQESLKYYYICFKQKSFKIVLYIDPEKTNFPKQKNF